MEDESAMISADNNDKIVEETLHLRRRNDMGELSSMKPCYQCKGFTGYGPMKSFSNPERSPFHYIAGVNIHSQSLEDTEENVENALEGAGDLNIFLTIGDCINDLVFIMALYTAEDDLYPAYFLCLKKTAYWNFFYFSEEKSESPSPDEWMLCLPKFFIQQDYNQVSFLNETADLKHVVETVVSHLFNVMNNDMYRHIFYPHHKPEETPITVVMDEDDQVKNPAIDQQPINKRITRGIEGRKNIVFYSDEFSNRPKASIDMNVVNAKVKKVSKKKKTVTATPKAKKRSIDKDSHNSNILGQPTIGIMTPASNQKGRKKSVSTSSCNNDSYYNDDGNEIEDNDCKFI